MKFKNLWEVNIAFEVLKKACVPPKKMENVDIAIKEAVDSMNLVGSHLVSKEYNLGEVTNEFQYS